MEGGASGGTHKASESAVRHVLLRLAECGDSFGHNQTWGGPPDPPPTPAQPPSPRRWARGAAPGGGLGRGGLGGGPGAGAPPPPLFATVLREPIRGPGDPSILPSVNPSEQSGGSHTRPHAWTVLPFSVAYAKRARPKR